MEPVCRSCCFEEICHSVHYFWIWRIYFSRSIKRNDYQQKGNYVSMNKTFQYDMSPACLQIIYHKLCASNAKTLHRCDQCILFIIDMGRFMTIIKATSPPLRRELSLNHARFLWLQCQVSGRGRSAVHPVPPHLCRAGTTAGNEGPRIFHNRRYGHPIRAFSWLKALTRAFPFKTLLTHCKLTPVYLA